MNVLVVLMNNLSCTVCVVFVLLHFQKKTPPPQLIALRIFSTAPSATDAVYNTNFFVEHLRPWTMSLSVQQNADLKTCITTQLFTAAQFVASGPEFAAHLLTVATNKPRPVPDTASSNFLLDPSISEAKLKYTLGRSLRGAHQTAVLELLKFNERPDHQRMAMLRNMIMLATLVGTGYVTLPSAPAARVKAAAATAAKKKFFTQCSTVIADILQENPGMTTADRRCGFCCVLCALGFYYLHI